MILIFTGNGKGKTTAAIGQAIRAIGNGSTALMVQFIKGPWESGEDISSQRLAPSFKIVKKGKGFVRMAGDQLPFETHVAAARDALAYATEEIKGRKWNILILDEIWNALHLGLLSTQEVSVAIKTLSAMTDHLILTGRDCPREFIETADIVTEMREVKHPLSTGITAGASIDY
jgi:cob(I)alamin adenosyltransferase